MVVECNEGSGMVFMMVPLDGKYRCPILAQIEDPKKLVFDLNNNKFVVLDKAGFCESWNCEEGRFGLDECGWNENLIVNTDIIKWCKIY